MVTLIARRGALLAALMATSLFVLATSASALPALDATFAGGVITPKVFADGKWAQIARGAVLQADGKVLVPMALSTKYGRRDERPVLRYNLDGSLDRSYGKDGVAWFGLAGEKQFGMNGIVLRPDGKSLVTGTTGDGRLLPGHNFVARLTASGRLDRSFGRKGATKVSRINDGRSREIYKAFPLENGKTIVAFQQSHEDDVSLDLMRLDKRGRIERGYGSNGIKSIDFAPGQAFPQLADVQIVGTDAFLLVNPDLEAFRYPCKLIRTSIQATGGLKKSYGKSGVATITSGTKTTSVGCTDLEPTFDGGVVVTAYLYSQDVESKSTPAVYKLGVDGTRDRTFGIDGKLIGVPGDSFEGIAQLPDSSFLLPGYRANPDPSASGPLGGTAYAMNGQGGLTDLLAGGTIPLTKSSYVTQFDHRASGNVVLYTQQTLSDPERASRIVRFTN